MISMFQISRNFPRNAFEFPQQNVQNFYFIAIEHLGLLRSECFGTDRTASLVIKGTGGTATIKIYNNRNRNSPYLFRSTLSRTI